MTAMYYDVIIFEASMSKVAGDRLGIVIPTWLSRKLEEKGLRGKKVIVHIYIPREES